jgi:hypothetical protein
MQPCGGDHGGQAGLRTATRRVKTQPRGGDLRGQAGLRAATRRGKVLPRGGDPMGQASLRATTRKHGGRAGHNLSIRRRRSRRGSWAGQRVCYNVVRTGDVANFGGKLCNEGELPSLPVRARL